MGLIWCRMTLGHVYDMDLKKNEAIIKEVIIQAQGEVRVYAITGKLWLTDRIVDGSRGIYQASEGNLD